MRCSPPIVMRHFVTFLADLTVARVPDGFAIRNGDRGLMATFAYALQYGDAEVEYTTNPIDAWAFPSVREATEMARDIAKGWDSVRAMYESERAIDEAASQYYGDGPSCWCGAC